MSFDRLGSSTSGSHFLALLSWSLSSSALCACPHFSESGYRCACFRDTGGFVLAVMTIPSSGGKWHLNAYEWTLTGSAFRSQRTKSAVLTFLYCPLLMLSTMMVSVPIAYMYRAANALRSSLGDLVLFVMMTTVPNCPNSCNAVRSGFCRNHDVNGMHSVALSPYKCTWKWHRTLHL